MVRVVIGIEAYEKTVHRIVLEVESQDEINVESCIEELRALAFKWAETWLRYPDGTVTIRNTAI